jgi:protein required for attachment to host cells
MMKLRLDTEGLRALIASNPELEIEIGKEVMNNITSEQLKNKVSARIDEVLKSMVTKGGSYYQPVYEIKDKNFLAAIAAASKSVVDKALDEAVKLQIAETVLSAVEAERIRLRAELKALLKEIVTPEMARDIMREKILL